MKKQICIIGGGIFGTSIYIKLKKSGYCCHLIESKKNKFVIGVGINISTDYIEFDTSIKNKAISLKIFKNKKNIVEIILAEILNKIEKKMISENNLIINEWMSNCMHVNQNIKYHDNQKIIKGYFSGITDNGEAVIKINNAEKIISSGSLIIWYY